MADTEFVPTDSEILFEEVDLFSTALIQGNCTSTAGTFDEDELGAVEADD